MIHGTYQNFAARKHHLQCFIGIDTLTFKVHPPCVHVHFQLAIDVHGNASTHVVSFNNVVKHQVLYMSILGRDESADRRARVRTVDASQRTRVWGEVAFIQDSICSPGNHWNPYSNLSQKWLWSSRWSTRDVAFLGHSVWRSVKRVARTEKIVRLNVRRK